MFQGWSRGPIVIENCHKTTQHTENFNHWLSPMHVWASVTFECLSTGWNCRPNQSRLFGKQRFSTYPEDSLVSSISSQIWPLDHARWLEHQLIHFFQPLPCHFGAIQKCLLQSTRQLPEIVTKQLFISWDFSLMKHPLGHFLSIQIHPLHVQWMFTMPHLFTACHISWLGQFVNVEAVSAGDTAFVCPCLWQHRQCLTAVSVRYPRINHKQPSTPSRTVIRKNTVCQQFTSLRPCTTPWTKNLLSAHIPAQASSSILFASESFAVPMEPLTKQEAAHTLQRATCKQEHLLV